MAEQNQFSDKRTIAVLIDGDNAQPQPVNEMLAEISKYGRTTIRRIYGDWTTPNMHGWKTRLQESAIQPIQQFRNTVGKNATDSAMIIDAMDILHSGHVGGICLVSSDSDYTRLATRVRENGLFVMGIGKQQTPKAFTQACDLFVFEENLVTRVESPDEKLKPPVAPIATQPVSSALRLVSKAMELWVRDDGWARSSDLGSALSKLDPSFDYRTFGCKNLKDLIGRLSGSFEMRMDKTSEGGAVSYVRYR